MQNSELSFGVRFSDNYSADSLLKHNPLESEHLNYEVKLQQGQLLVRLSQSDSHISLLSSRNKQFLTEWLQYCPARLVRIDPALGAVKLQLWADACMQAGKVIFLRVPPEHKLPKRQSPVSWWLKRLVDWIVAVLLLLIFSPVFLGLALLIYFHSPGPIFSHQWCVGERGKLFQTLKFRTAFLNETEYYQATNYQQDLHNCKDELPITPLGYWMRKSSLDKLPQLFNVVRGEMSLVGPHAWALKDAIRISFDAQKRLNALPGITGTWQVKAKSEMLDLELGNHCEVAYLRNWSLLKDLRILLMALSKLNFFHG